MIRDDAWFDVLYRRHRAAVAAYCSRRIGQIDAEDHWRSTFRGRRLAERAGALPAPTPVGPEAAAIVRDAPGTPPWPTTTRCRRRGRGARTRGRQRLVVGHRRGRKHRRGPIRFGVVPVSPDAEQRVAHAIATTRLFLDRVNDGDIDTAMTLLQPAERLDAHREMWSPVARIAERTPTEIGTCRASGVFGPFIDVECNIVHGDPVFRAVGVADLLARFRVRDEGTVSLLSYERADLGHVVSPPAAYVDYLRAFHGAEYEAVCDPRRYGEGEAVKLFRNDGGLAMTEACGDLFVPLADEVARWVEAGRPPP